MIGCFVALKCFVACVFFDESQQPTCPQLRHMRSFTHGSPVLRHSSQPFVLGLTSLRSLRWVQAMGRDEGARYIIVLLGVYASLPLPGGGIGTQQGTTLINPLPNVRRRGGDVLALDEQVFPAARAQSAVPGAPLSPAAQIGAIATKLKLAEGRYANLHKRNQLTEETLLALDREMKEELRAVTAQLMEVRKHVVEINAKVDAIMGELSGVARRHELGVVERYLDLWEPVQFVTRDEAKRIIRDALAAPKEDVRS